MFDLELTRRNGLFTFNRQLPVFNWYYPFNVSEDRLPAPTALLLLWALERNPAQRRAVYVHVPFCETICSFCPFTRGRYRSDQEINDYVEGLLGEIEIKRNLIGRTKVDAVFVGGGTPSVLSPIQIERLGYALHTHLDTTNLSEFTFELEVKSVTREKLEAMQRIGVNRVSFGAQTFAAPHRALFSLDATISQIHDVAEMATEMFVYTNIDMIYGMAGQTTEDLYADVNQALSLRTTTVDFYPLNNLAAQVRMHHLAHKAGLRHLTAARRVQYRRAIDEHLRAQGYSPINGYSYSRTQKSNRATLQHQPKFQYHDILYGYHDDAVLGYGASALTQVPGYNVYNHVDRTEYVSRIRAGALPWEGFAVGDCSEKGIVTFPYRGSLKKSRIPWERVPAETHIAFTEAIEAGLIIDGSETYDLSQQGWLFYVNLMYYLMPAKGKRWISDRIAARISNGRECEHTVLEEDEGEESRLQ